MRGFLHPMPRVVEVPPEDVDLCRRFAVEAELGGMSNVRTLEARKKALKPDQFVGQIGELVGCQHVLGVDPGRAEYVQVRKLRGANPRKGDGGSDMLSVTNVDFKASRMSKWLIRTPWLHHLMVREREYHWETVYVLILVWFPPEGSHRNVIARIEGWARLDERHLTDAVTKWAPQGGLRHELEGTYLMRHRESGLVTAHRRTHDVM
jgi:hypothetical protein